MSIAFLIVFPLGALFVRSLKFKGSVWVHVACQMVGWVLIIAGLCLGDRTGKMIFQVRPQYLTLLPGLSFLMSNNLQLFNNTHTRLGIVVVVLLLLQPFIGLIHHRRYLSKQKAGKWTYLHVWYGRILILLGMINGGLGLQLADNSMGGTIAYGVVAGTVGLFYCGGMVVVELKRWRQGQKTTSNVPMKESNNPETA